LEEQERVDDVLPTCNKHNVVPTVDSCDKVLQDVGPIHNPNLSFYGLADPNVAQDSFVPRVVLSINEEGSNHALAANGSPSSCNTPISNVSASSHNVPIDDEIGGSRREQLLRGLRIIKRTTSCPPGRNRYATTGSWSLEWVNSQNIDILEGNMPFAKQVSFNSSSFKGSRANKKIKGAGYLHHTAQSMRRIARLPAKDREDVLRALKKMLERG